MASFAQKFGSTKKDSGGNSIQEEKILASVEQANEDLAERVSDATSSEGNIEAVLTRGSDDLTPDVETKDKILPEQETEEGSVERLITAIELTDSPEELLQLVQQHEEFLARWSKKSALMHSKKHLKEYLSVIAALRMLKEAMQSPEQLKGNQLSQILQNSLKMQAQNIADHAKELQALNRRLHEQKQSLTKQLPGIEKSLQVAAEALKKESGKLKPVQEMLKQAQMLKEKSTSKEIARNLQQIQQKLQSVIESSKAADTALRSKLQSTLSSSQQKIQQALKQTDIARQAQESISKVAKEFSRNIQQQVSRLSNELARNNTAQKSGRENVINLSAKLSQPGQQAQQPRTDITQKTANNNRNNILDATAKLKERNGLTNKQTDKNSLNKNNDKQNQKHDLQKKNPKALGKDNGHVCTASCNHGHDHGHGHKHHDHKPLGKGHVCTASCNHGHEHTHNKKSPKGLVNDNPHKCHPGCGHANENQVHKAMGKDSVSKGCCGGKCNGHHDESHGNDHQRHHTHEHKPHEKHHKHEHKHGSDCPCCKPDKIKLEPALKQQKSQAIGA